MQTKVIESVEGLLELAQKYVNKAVIYRGVTSSDYELVPKIGRRRKRGGDALEVKDERYVLRLFKQRSIAHLHRDPKDDWE